MENVLALGFPVEDGTCKFFCFFNGFCQDSLLSFQYGPVFIANLNSWFDHIGANNLNARFYVEPVELVYFVLCQSFLGWLLNFDFLFFFRFSAFFILLIFLLLFLLLFFRRFNDRRLFFSGGEFGWRLRLPASY